MLLSTSFVKRVIPMSCREGWAKIKRQRIRKGHWVSAFEILLCIRQHMSVYMKTKLIFFLFIFKRCVGIGMLIRNTWPDNQMLQHKITSHNNINYYIPWSRMKQKTLKSQVIRLLTLLDLKKKKIPIISR